MADSSCGSHPYSFPSAPYGHLAISLLFSFVFFFFFAICIGWEFSTSLSSTSFLLNNLSLSHFSLLKFYYKMPGGAKPYLRHFFLEVTSVKYQISLVASSIFHKTLEHKSQLSQVLCHFLQGLPFLRFPVIYSSFLSEMSPEWSLPPIFLPTFCLGIPKEDWDFLCRFLFFDLSSELPCKRGVPRPPWRSNG